MSDQTPFDEIMRVIPSLRAYARSLARSRTDADDLVQETLVKAIANIAKFEPGTSMRAWLFTIMRNYFYTCAFKRRREGPGIDDCVSNLLTSKPDHDRIMNAKLVFAAVDRLPRQFREALVLSVIMGESYDETARICGVGIGTVKSRINRARQLLMQDLGKEFLSDALQD